MLFSEYIGFRLGDVKEKIEENGYIIDQISITSPKKYYKYNNESRIVKIDIIKNNKIKIFVCISL